MSIATAHGHLATVGALLSVKADINAKSRQRSTAPLLAVKIVKIPGIDF